MAVHLFGCPLNETDFEKLGRDGIRRGIAEQGRYRRITDYEAREMGFSRNGAGGDFGGMLFPNLLPGEDDPREYCLRRDHPDLEMGTDGTVRHPPQSGWLDELGRLKGGWFSGLGVARCAP